MRRTASSVRYLWVRPVAAARIAALTSLMLLGVYLMPASGAATARANGAILVQITGVPAAASEIIIEAQSPFTTMGVPKKISLYSLVTVPASGRTAMVTVPSSRLLAAIAVAQHGWVNLAAIAVSATRAYGRMFPVHLSSTGVATAAVADIGRVSFRRAGSILSSDAPKVDACVYLPIKSTEGVSRIGELHIANSSGMVGHYENRYTADVNSSVGGSGTGGDG